MAKDLFVQPNVTKSTPKLCTLSDRFGNTFHYGNAGDFWHPPFPIGADTDYRTHVRKVRNMDIRDDDVILCSFPKTGLHWHTEIIGMLVTGKAEYQPEHKLYTILDLYSMEYVESRPSPRILLTHFPFRHLPKQVWEKKIKVVYLVRNPKDVLVSWYNHLKAHNIPLGYEGSFEEFVTLSLECGFYYGDMFDYLMEWQESADGNPQVPVYTSVYEEILKDPVINVERLNDYLGTGCSKEVCKDIADACQFDKLKAFKDSTRPKHLQALLKKPSSSYYRKGTAGDWENCFTPKLLEMYEEEYKKRMAGYRIQFS